MSNIKCMGKAKDLTKVTSDSFSPFSGIFLTNAFNLTLYLYFFFSNQISQEVARDRVCLLFLKINNNNNNNNNKLGGRVNLIQLVDL